MDTGRSADLILACIDPLGLRIEVGRERWEGHLRPRHPEVATRVEAVRLTLERPDRILADVDNPDGLNYYRAAALPPPQHRFYLKVCISFHRRDRHGPLGAFVTAYPTKGIRRGEVQRWP